MVEITRLRCQIFCGMEESRSHFKTSPVVPATACRIKLQRWRKAGIQSRKQILDQVENDAFCPEFPN